MITFDEALQLAKKAYPEIGSCTEYEAAYEFYSSSAAVSIGGVGSPVIVEKSTGQLLNFVFALGDGLLDTEIGPVEILHD